MSSVSIDQPFGSDHVQARYWQSPVSRLEVQQALDQQAVAINTLIETVGGRFKKDPEGNVIQPVQLDQPGIIHALAKVDLFMRFILEAIGKTPEDFQAWSSKQMAQAQAAKDAASVTDRLGREA